MKILIKLIKFMYYKIDAELWNEKSKIVRKKIKKILEILLTAEDKRPEAFWIRIPERFVTEKERHNFIQQTINFVNRKTRTINKTKYVT